MAKKEAKKENSKNKKSFFNSFKAELKRVIWPTPKQLINSTIAVVTIVLIVAAIVFILDITFETLNKQGVDKLKEIITTNNSVSENTTVEDTNTENVIVEDTNNVTDNSVVIENNAE